MVNDSIMAKCEKNVILSAKCECNFYNDCGNNTDDACVNVNGSIKCVSVFTDGYMLDSEPYACSSSLAPGQAVLFEDNKVCT